MSFSRRDFFKILGITAVGSQISVDTLASSPVLKDLGLAFKGISADFQDRLLLAEGLSYKVLLQEGQPITKNLKFGTNNDFLQFFELSGPEHGILWVNHEYLTPLLSSKVERTKEVIEKERYFVGGSLVEIKKEKGEWVLIKDSVYNRRIDGTTVIPFAGGKEIMGKKEAIGTLANCAGGRTPWGTVLTCEENYDGFYGETDRKTGKHIDSYYLAWDKFYSNPPEHYGWVVEVDPKTGHAKKHTTLGRFAHECATTVKASDGRTVVYSGDDTNDEHLYKFISSKKDSLEEGTLYVANLERGQWLPLVHSDSRLKKVFKDQTEILINCREAAKILGATPLDRPEDIEIDPANGSILVACTNNKPKNRPHGLILKIKERGNNPLSLSFTHETFLTGGEKGGLSCPDNMAFDPAGNLWITTDITGSDMHKGVQQNFGNNGLFVVMKTGPMAGIPIQLASAPTDSEFTGPFFSSNGKTLFISVQHPGEQTTDLNNPTSRWPNGDLPKSSVITIEGPLLNKITSI
jgi:secreted PhoX family phosphatase